MPYSLAEFGAGSAIVDEPPPLAPCLHAESRRRESADARDAAAEDHCDLLLVSLPGFSIFSIISMVEVFRRANLLLDRPYYRWSFVIKGQDDATAQALSGLLAGGDPLSGAEVDRAWRRCSYTLVFTNGAVADLSTSPAVSVVRAAHRAGSIIAEIGSGAFLLPSLGLLDCASYAVHPKYRGVFRERFPEIEIDEALFTVGRRTMSCCGEIGALELGLFLVEGAHGRGIAGRIRRSLLLEERLDGRDGRSAPSPWIGRAANKHIRRAVAAMQRHIDRPLAQTEVAALCGLSCRQIQRLFTSHTGRSFIEFYMRMRLDHALQLILQTDMQILDIALACGFSNGSYFSQVFRARWGETPSALRRHRQMAQAS